MGQEWKKVLIIFVGNMFFLGIISIATICIKIFSDQKLGSKTLLIWARCLGFISLTFTAFQCAPQIYKTWKIKTIGALSIPAMSIQTPGTILLIISLVSQPNSDYSMWLSYLLSATCQGILLTQCIYYSYFYKSNTLDDIRDKSPTTATISKEKSPTIDQSKDTDSLIIINGVVTSEHTS